MKTIKLLLLLFVATLSFVPAVHADDSLKPNEKQMLGLWEEYSPGSNCVEFFKDHTMRIYLTEEEGRKSRDMHFYELKWRLDDGNVLTLTAKVGDKSIEEKGKVALKKNGEMWLTDDQGTTTRNRHIGAVPARYKW